MGNCEPPPPVVPTPIAPRPYAPPPSSPRPFSSFLRRQEPAYGERAAGAWSLVLKPQQAIVPSVLMPHENEVPALTAL